MKEGLYIVFDMIMKFILVLFLITHYIKIEADIISTILLGIVGFCWTVFVPTQSGKKG